MTTPSSTPAARSRRRVVIWQSAADNLWRYTWKAGNSLKRGEGGQGYKRKEDAVLALEDITGGWVEITYRRRANADRAQYQQGILHRAVLRANTPVARRDDMFVEVLGQVQDDQVGNA